MNKLLLLGILMWVFLSCQKNDISDSVNSDIEELKLITPEEIEERTDGIVYDENNIGELLSKVNSKMDFILTNKGYKKIKDNHDMENAQTLRASVLDYSVIYPISSLCPLYTIDGEQWVKIKFSAKMVDIYKEDYKGLMQYDIKAGKTYVCAWRFQEPIVELASNQVFGSKVSPNCGLKPSDRTNIERFLRDYESYETSDPKKIALLTYVLQIICYDADGPTTRFEQCYLPATRGGIDIGYGYEYNYAILTF